MGAPGKTASRGIRMDGRDISIIIVNWNTRKLLAQCLQSFARRISRYKSEIIVVDNGSTDGSVEMIARDFPNVKRILNDRNLGFAKANNLGIQASSGRYVCLMNSDILVLRDCLDRLAVYMDEHAGIGIAAPKLYNADMRPQISCKHFPSLWKLFCEATALHRIFRPWRIFNGDDMAYFDHNSLRKVDSVAGAFLLVRRKAMDEVGLLDEDFYFYGEDIDWCKRFRKFGWDISFFPGAEAVHYGGGSSSRDPKRFSREKMKAILQYWKKHHTVLERLLLYSILLLHQGLRIGINSFVYLMSGSKKNEIFRRLGENAASIQGLFRVKSIK
jgi:GT2 family glycosyltransferase